jgi:hypothetical protein
MNKFYFLSASVQEMSVNKLWMDRCSAALVTHSSIHGTGVLLSAAAPPTVKWGGAVSCMQCAMAMASPHPYQLLLTASDFF